MKEHNEMGEPRRWMDYGTSGTMPPVEVVATADYDALRARVAKQDALLGSLRNANERLRQLYDNEHTETCRLRARVAELEASEASKRGIMLAQASRLAELEADAARYRVLRGNPWLALDRYDTSALHPAEVDRLMDQVRLSGSDTGTRNG